MAEQLSSGQHRAAAEAWLQRAEMAMAPVLGVDWSAVQAALAHAQVHATLATAPEADPRDARVSP